MPRTLQFSSVAQLCPTLCNPMDCSAPGFPVHHQHPKLAQVGDAIQPRTNQFILKAKRPRKNYRADVWHCVHTQL